MFLILFFFISFVL